MLRGFFVYAFILSSTASCTVPSIFNHDFKTALPFEAMNAYNANEFNLTHNVVSHLAELVLKMRWTEIVIFYDSSREDVYDLLTVQLQMALNGVKPRPVLLAFETTSSFWKQIYISLNNLQDRLSPIINVIILCNEENTTQLLSVVTSLDDYPMNIQDYTHNSFWLAVAEDDWIPAIMNSSLYLENMIIYPYSYTQTVNVNLSMKTKARHQICKCMCEEPFVYAAYDVVPRRSWKWFSYNDIPSDGDSVMRLLYPNTQYGYNGRELRVVVKENTFCLHKAVTSNVTHYYGFCVDIFMDIATKLNFSYLFRDPMDGEWGREENGSWNGIIGEIQRGEADISISLLTLTASRMRAVDFLTPSHSQAKILILYRLEQTGGMNFLALLEPFEWRVYLVLLVVLIVIPLAYYFIVEMYRTDGRSHGVSEVYFYFIGSLSQQGGNLQPTSCTGRFLVFSFWLCSICLAASYSAYLTASLTVTTNVKPFKDLGELLQRTDYKIGVTTLGATVTTLEGTTSGVNKELWQRIVKNNKTDPSIFDANETRQLERVIRGKYAVVAFDTFVEKAIKTYCQLVYLKSPILEQELSFIVRKGSPYKRDMDMIMSRIVDSNIGHHYMKRFDRNLTGEPKTCEPVSMTSVPIDFMTGIACFLGLGSGIATLVLLLECLIGKMFKNAFIA